MGSGFLHLADTPGKLFKLCREDRKYPDANRYHLAFMSTVNELLKQLMDFHAYDLLHRDAALALTIAPENTKAYYWLIRSYQKQHMDEMAAGELAAAKQKLPEDEYQKLLNSLER